MKKLIAAALALSIGIAAYGEGTASETISILPLPAEVVVKDKTVQLPSSVVVHIDARAELKKEYINTLLSEMGFSPVYSDREAGAKIVLKLNDTQRNASAEAYELNTGKKITATADGSAGLLYALQSLRQIAEPTPEGVSVPVCTIKDAPAFPWRAFMLDEGRHFQGKETVKKLLDEMARLKMNTFHWHLVDDQGWRIEIKKYPKLTEIGSKSDFSHMGLSPESWDSIHPGRAYYTQDEIREIVRYAAERNIRIIPEIEMPGHASAAIRSYPWVGTSSRAENKGIHGDLFNITDPAVEQFLHDILDETIALFPSKIVHIGGDEVAYQHWEKSEEVSRFMQENDIPTCADLQIWLNNRTSEYLRSRGCRMIGWNEITGDNIRGEAHVKASQSGKLAPETIVQFWDGDISLVNKAIAKGYDVVNSNRFFTYLDYPYEVTPLEKAYSFNPVPEGLADEDRPKILGLGCQIWGEYTPTTDRIYFQVFPRFAAFAECGWVPAERKDFAQFQKRLEKIKAIWQEKGYWKH